MTHDKFKVLREGKIKHIEKILLKLKAETEKICADAVKDKGEIGGAVNWADLHCQWSEFYRDSEGDSGLEFILKNPHLIMLNYKNIFLIN